MTIAWGTAAVAGVVATAVMTLLMYTAKAMSLPLDLPRTLGLIFAPPAAPGSVTASDPMKQNQNRLSREQRPQS